MGLLKALKPEWWFAAHLHTRFEATVVHDSAPAPPAPNQVLRNPDEILIDDDDDNGKAKATGEVGRRIKANRESSRCYWSDTEPNNR